jgi:hypothetical protein
MKNMENYNRAFRYDDGILTICLTGTFPNDLLDEEDNLFQPLIDECLQRNCRKVLFDARDLEADLGTLGLLQAGKNAATLAHIGLRVAFVAREDMLDRFFESVSFNRGGTSIVFTKMNTAREWFETE